MSARPLAFRYLYKSGVIKENTVTVFGELGSVFQKGTDYDEEVDLNVPYMDLSNLIMYYTGTVADGTVGSTEEGSLRNLNAPVSNVEHFLKFSNADNSKGANHYYVGDIVLFDPITGTGNSSQASCWTCIKTTSDLTSPIPELVNEIAAASAANTSYNTNFNGTGKSGPGMSGVDNNGQRFIVGVLPATYDSVTGDITVNPYWRESALAKSYFTNGNYYQGEIVVFNAGVYRCKSTNGMLADPPLYQRVRYTIEQERDDAAGIANAIPGLDLELAPSGAFGYDSSGTRYLMGVPPAGGLFSGLFWEPATLPKTPSGAYLNVNWDNTSITDKLQFYDANVVGGAGAQSIPTFSDDVGNTVTTLRKIYDDNEKSFVLTIANQILSTIPAAAIKSQAVNPRVDPDNTLVELVHLGPSDSKPTQYKPAVQGLFEESLARDMLRISGYANTITEIVVTDGSSGYRTVPRVTIDGGLATNPKLVPFAARALARLGVKSIKIDKTDPTWNSTNTGTRFAIGDVISFVSVAAPTVACTAKVYRIDSAGNILSILVTNKGSGYSDLPTVTVKGVTRTFLEPVLEVVSVDLQYSDTGFYNDMKVVVNFGSGAGAVGYAVVENINGVSRLTEVKFDVTTQTDPNSNESFSISRGSNYVSGNFKKDIVALQGYVYESGTWNQVVTAKSVGVVTRTQGGAIADLVVIKNGSGYTTHPEVRIDSPAVDVRENGKLVKDLSTGTVVPSSHLALIESSGVYTSPPPINFYIEPSLTYPLSENVFSKTYLGLNLADVKLGGSGYSQGEYMSVSGGGIVPAKFNVIHTPGADASDPGTYSALVMEGGDGYSINTGNAGFNDIVLQDDSLGATNRDQLRANIVSVGGGIVDIKFNNGKPTGAGFAVDDVIEVTATGGNFRFKVTSVGDEGTIAPEGHVLRGKDGQLYEGYTPGQTLTATSRFFSIDTLTLQVPGVFTAEQPLVNIPAPTGSHEHSAGTAWQSATATAVASLKVNNISIINAGSGYQLGDVITITQAGALSCEAVVLALANTTTGSVGVIAIRNAGSGFDLSGAITVNLPTTGTSLEVNVSYTVHKLVVTNPGLGYESPPTVTLSHGGNDLAVTATIKKAGGSTATFRVTQVDSGTNEILSYTQLSPGSGYLVGDILALSDADGVGSGNYIEVTGIQSRGVKTGTIVPGYRGSENVVSSVLTDAACSKVGSLAIFPNIKYSVTKVTPPNSISRLTILDYVPGASRYQSPTSLSHKPHARVKVANVDAIGSILSLTVESQGYGYSSLPTIKPLPGTRGTGASLFAVSLGVSRVEFVGAPLETVIAPGVVRIAEDGILPNSTKVPATALAQLAGDLNTISTDGLKNPNILETLESLKPGSTSGYAQAKPNMGVSSVTVVFSGRGYQTGNDSNGDAITSLQVTEPDLPNGVRPSFGIDFDANGGITNVRVLTSGSGYSKMPKALVKMSTSDTPNVEASVTLNMRLIDGYVISGGEGYSSTLPSISVTTPDSNVGNSIATLLPTMKTSINGFNIESPGLQYLEPPKALIIGPGNGGEALARMGVSDIYVVNGGSGYAVGDMLNIPGPTLVGSPAAATVLDVNSTGAITRVGLVKSRFPVVASVLSALKNDFLSNGGSGYETLPVIPDVLYTPVGGVELYSDGAVNTADLIASAGTGAVFSVRLGVNSIQFSSPGNDYESDATVLIQEPPPSQAARFSAVINGVGQLNAFVKTSSGSGYTKAPGVVVNGGSGAGASVTALMGVSGVSIIKSGKGYTVGDVVTFTGGNPTEPATGVVTLIDEGTPGIGYNLDLRPRRVLDEPGLSVDSATGKLVGKAGAIKDSLILNTGYNFRVNDILTVVANRKPVLQLELDAIRAVKNLTKVESGKLTRISLIGNYDHLPFKTGTILKVTPVDPALTGVAYVRINTLFGTPGISSVLYEGGYIVRDQFSDLYPYGRLYPGMYSRFDFATQELPEGYNIPAQDFVTVIASNEDWGNDPTVYVSNDENTDSHQKLKFEVLDQDEVNYPGSTAYFKVTQTVSSVGAVLQASPCDVTGSLTDDTGLFFTPFDIPSFTGPSRGEISFIQVLNSGSGYQSSPTAVITSSSSTVPAEVVTSLGVVNLRIDQRGSGYLSNPELVIEAPQHRSLVAQAYARSGVFDIDVHDFEVIDQGSGYTGKFLDATNLEQDGGTYRLVGGALHQTGGSAESVDTVLTIRPEAFVGGKLATSRGTVRSGTDVTVRGSNYRVGDIVSIVAIGSTTSGNQATPARILIKQISKMLDTNNGLTNNADYNTGAGIFDYGKQQNGEDIGGYGTGYFQPPFVRILGGNQGVTLTTSLGVVAVDYLIDPEGRPDRGFNYQVGDSIQITSPEFPNPVTIGIVSRVEPTLGNLLGTTLYEPFTKGLNVPPTLTVLRKNPAYVSPDYNASDWGTNVDALIRPVLGVTVASTTTSSDGFIGRPYVYVASPYGNSQYQPPTVARITPILVNEVSKVNVFYDNTPPEYVTSAPRISIAPPLSIEKYSGWRSVRFNKDDSFEVIVQYTIAKAISFQVDPDASLPSSYFTATAITIGGVVIPLRQSGGKGMQGRELSANKIIRRYKIKLIAV